MPVYGHSGGLQAEDNCQGRGRVRKTSVKQSVPVVHACCGAVFCKIAVCLSEYYFTKPHFYYIFSPICPKLKSKSAVIAILPCILPISDPYNAVGRNYTVLIILDCGQYTKDMQCNYRCSVSDENSFTKVTLCNLGGIQSLWSD